jgi:hypothetical protein
MEGKLTYDLMTPEGLSLLAGTATQTSGTFEQFPCREANTQGPAGLQPALEIDMVLNASLLR